MAATMWSDAVDDRKEPEPGSWDRCRRAGWDEYRAARERLRALLARQSQEARRGPGDEAASPDGRSGEEGDDE
jgi:hypothetical protein